MAEYDKLSAERVQIEKDAVGDEDDDGWKTVTKKYFFSFGLIYFIILNCNYVI